MRFCSNCGSTSVEPDNSHTNKLGEIIANQNKWVCRECGYRGLMPEGEPEDVENAEEIEFEPKKQPEIDTDLGRAYFRFFIYISIPLSIGYLLFKILTT